MVLKAEFSGVHSCDCAAGEAERDPTSMENGEAVHYKRPRTVKRVAIDLRGQAMLKVRFFGIVAASIAKCRAGTRSSS